MNLFERLGVALPIVQAGMGGGIAGHRLAAAVSESGGLGTIGMLDAPRLRDELRRARELTAKPVAVNLLLPFARRDHWEVAREADAVVTFWGPPVRGTPGVWIHQCGSLAEAQQAHAADADAVIVQGVEAGGHVRGSSSALDLAEQVRRLLPSCPVLIAGGIAEAEDVRRALEHGAVGVVAGTRFLLSEESLAHPQYKRRVMEATKTILTELFGFGWPAPHRVIPNAATERWLSHDARGPRAVRLINHLTGPALAKAPLSAAARMTLRQRPHWPLLGPSPPLVSSDERLVDATPLYAGETVARLHDVRPAAELIRALAP